MTQSFRVFVGITFAFGAACTSALPKGNGLDPAAAPVISSLSGDGANGRIATGLLIMGKNLERVDTVTLLDGEAVLGDLLIGSAQSTTISTVIPAAIESQLVAGSGTYTVELSSSAGAARQDVQILRGEAGANGAMGPTGPAGSYVINTTSGLEVTGGALSLAAQGCAEGDVMKRVGGGWACAPESDPAVVGQTWTRYVVVMPSDFGGHQSTKLPFGEKTNAMLRPTGPGEATQMYATVHLPHGATPTLVKCWAWDNDATLGNKVVVQLNRYGFTLAGIASSGACGFGETTQTSADAQLFSFNATCPTPTQYSFDMTGVSYYLSVSVTAVNPELGLAQCSVAYTISEPLP